jgi:hypothetical protein
MPQLAWISGGPTFAMAIAEMTPKQTAANRIIRSMTAPTTPWGTVSREM